MRKSQPAEKPPDPSLPAKTVAARRKNPWLLGLAALLVAGWLTFLAAMAFRG